MDTNSDHTTEIARHTPTEAADIFGGYLCSCGASWTQLHEEQVASARHHDGWCLVRRPNWSWVAARLAFWRCRHAWMVGDRKTGAKACSRCGTWRWFPTTPAGGRLRLGRSTRRADTHAASEVAAAPPAGRPSRPGTTHEHYMVREAEECPACNPSTGPGQVCNERGVPEDECPPHCSHDYRVSRPGIPDCSCSAGNDLPFPAQHATLCPRFAVGRTDLGGSDG